MSSGPSTPLVTIRATERTMVAGGRSASTLARRESACEQDRGIGRSSCHFDEPRSDIHYHQLSDVVLSKPILNRKCHGAAVNRERCHVIARYEHCDSGG